jgi:hypothetical protein
MRDLGHHPIEALEPFLDAIHEGVSRVGWIPVSQEVGGREYLSGAGTRSPVRVARTAVVRFHRSDLPCEVMLEIRAEQGEQGLAGALSLVLSGPRYSELGPAATVLDRVTGAIRETFSKNDTIAVSLDLGLASALVPGPEARIQLRITSPMPPGRMAEGPVSIRCLLLSDIGAMERLLECPEIAEFLPPVAE